MRKLTTVEIEKLASRKGVRRIAVENFLMSMSDLTESQALANLALDSSSYKWNTLTTSSIRRGILLANKDLCCSQT